MTNQITLSLSLGSGPKAQDLAEKLKKWAGTKPLSQAIRELLEREVSKIAPNAPGLDSTQSRPPE